MFVGGNLIGDRLNFELKDLVPGGQVVPLLVKLFEAFKKERRGEEAFGDFCVRLGADQLRVLLG